MTAVIGIDPSLSATGVAWPDGTTEVIAWPGRGAERLEHVWDWVADLVAVEFYCALHDDELLVVVEGYAHGRANQAHQMGELGGVLRLALHRCGIPFLDVPPAVLKKYATGRGNANKDLVRDAARDRLCLPAGVTSDQCDAAWLRQIGLALAGDPAAVAVPALHRSALDKLTNPKEGS